MEAGASFVTVHLGGWDHHWNLESGMESYLPRVDELVAALFNDLDQRGILRGIDLDDRVVLFDADDVGELLEEVELLDFGFMRNVVD